jgi:hypothetical protein
MSNTGSDSKTKFRGPAFCAADTDTASIALEEAVPCRTRGA